MDVTSFYWERGAGARTTTNRQRPNDGQQQTTTTAATTTATTRGDKPKTSKDAGAPRGQTATKTNATLHRPWQPNNKQQQATANKTDDHATTPQARHQAARCYRSSTWHSQPHQTNGPNKQQLATGQQHAETNRGGATSCGQSARSQWHHKPRRTEEEKQPRNKSIVCVTSQT